MKRSEAFLPELLVKKGYPLSTLLYVLALHPLLRRVRMANPALQGVQFIGRVRAKVSACADGITVFVSRRSDIKVLKVQRIAGAKINFDKGKA